MGLYTEETRTVVVHSPRGAGAAFGGNVFEFDARNLPPNNPAALINAITAQNGTIITGTPGVRPLGHGYSLRDALADGRLSVWMINSGPFHEPVVAVVNHSTHLPGTARQHPNPNEIWAIEGWRPSNGKRPYLNAIPLIIRDSNYDIQYDQLLRAAEGIAITQYQPTGFTNDFMVIAAGNNAMNVIESYDGFDRFRLRTFGMSSPQADPTQELNVDCTVWEAWNSNKEIGLGEQLPIRHVGSSDAFTKDPNYMSVSATGAPISLAVSGSVIEVDMGDATGTISPTAQQHSRLAIVIATADWAPADAQAEGTHILTITGTSIDPDTGEATAGDTETIDISSGQATPLDPETGSALTGGEEAKFLYRRWDFAYVTSKYWRTDSPGDYPQIALTTTALAHEIDEILVYRAADPYSEDDVSRQVYMAYAWIRRTGSYQSRGGHSLPVGHRKYPTFIPVGNNGRLHGFTDPLPEEEPTHIAILARSFDLDIEDDADARNVADAFYAVREIPIRYDTSSEAWVTNSGFSGHDIPIADVLVDLPYGEILTTARQDSWPGGLLALGGCTGCAEWRGHIWAWGFTRHNFEHIVALGNVGGLGTFMSTGGELHGWMIGRTLVFQGQSYTIRRILDTGSGWMPGARYNGTDANGNIQAVYTELFTHGTAVETELGIPESEHVEFFVDEDFWAQGIQTTSPFVLNRLGIEDGLCRDSLEGAGPSNIPALNTLRSVGLDASQDYSIKMHIVDKKGISGPSAISKSFTIYVGLLSADLNKQHNCAGCNLSLRPSTTDWAASIIEYNSSGGIVGSPSSTSDVDTDSSGEFEVQVSGSTVKLFWLGVERLSKTMSSITLGDRIQIAIGNANAPTADYNAYISDVSVTYIPSESGAPAQCVCDSKFEGASDSEDVAFLKEEDSVLRFTINDAIYAEVAPVAHLIRLPENDRIRSFQPFRDYAIVQGERITWVLRYGAGASPYQEQVIAPPTLFERSQSENGAAGPRATTIVEGEVLTYTGRGISMGIQPDSLTDITTRKNGRLWRELVLVNQVEATQVAYDQVKRLVMLANVRTRNPLAKGLPEWAVLLDAQNNFELGLCYPFPVYANGVANLTEFPASDEYIRDGLLVFFVDVSAVGSTTAGIITEPGKYLVVGNTIQQNWKVFNLADRSITGIAGSFTDESDLYLAGWDRRGTMMGLDGRLRLLAGAEGERQILEYSVNDSVGGVVSLTGAASLGPAEDGSYRQYYTLAASPTGNFLALGKSSDDAGGSVLYEIDKTTLTPTQDPSYFETRRRRLIGEAFGGRNLVPAILIGPSGEIIVAGYIEDADNAGQYHLYLRRIDPETFEVIGEDSIVTGYLDTGGSLQTFSGHPGLQPTGSTVSPRQGILQIGINKHGDIFFTHIDSSYNRRAFRYRFPCNGYTGPGGNAGKATQLSDITESYGAGTAIDIRGAMSMMIDQRGLCYVLTPEFVAASSPERFRYVVTAYGEDDTMTEPLGRSVGTPIPLVVERSGYSRQNFGFVVAGEHIYHLVKDTNLSTAAVEWRLIQSTGFLGVDDYDGGPEIRIDGPHGEQETDYTDLVAFFLGTGGTPAMDVRMAGNMWEVCSQACQANGTELIGHRNLGKF